MDERKEPSRKLGYIECPTVAYIEGKYGIELRDRQKPHYIYSIEGEPSVIVPCARCKVEVVESLNETDEAVCSTCFAELQVRVGMAAQKGFRMGA